VTSGKKKKSGTTVGGNPSEAMPNCFRRLEKKQAENPNCAEKRKKEEQTTKADRSGLQGTKYSKVRADFCLENTRRGGIPQNKALNQVAQQPRPNPCLTGRGNEEIEEGFLFSGEWDWSGPWTQANPGGNLGTKNKAGVVTVHT